MSHYVDVSSHLYKRVCPFVGPLVRRSVHPSVGSSVTRFFQTAENTEMDGIELVVTRGEDGGDGGYRPRRMAKFLFHFE